MQIVFTLAAAAAFGLLAQRLQIPGGLIFGSMIGAALVTLAADSAGDIPVALRSAAFIGVGAVIGVRLDRDAVGALVPVLLPALLSGLLIILAGLAIAYLLRGLGMALPGDVLATSPGALSVVVGMAAEQGLGEAQVAVFHLVRIVMVLVSLPLLLLVVDRPG